MTMLGRLAHAEHRVVSERDNLGQDELAAELAADCGGERAEQLRRHHAVLLRLVVVRQAQHLHG